MKLVNAPDGASERLGFEPGSNHFDLFKHIQRDVSFDTVFDTGRIRLEAFECNGVKHI